MLQKGLAIEFDLANFVELAMDLVDCPRLLGSRTLVRRQSPYLELQTRAIVVEETIRRRSAHHCGTKADAEVQGDIKYVKY